MKKLCLHTSYIVLVLIRLEFSQKICLKRNVLRLIKEGFMGPFMTFAAKLIFKKHLHLHNLTIHSKF